MRMRLAAFYTTLCIIHKNTCMLHESKMCVLLRDKFNLTAFIPAKWLLYVAVLLYLLCIISRVEK